MTTPIVPSSTRDQWIRLRASAEDVRLLEDLHAQLGLTRSDIIRLALRGHLAALRVAVQNP